MENRKILATGIMLLFAFSLISAVIPVKAAVSGEVSITRPDMVAPGCPIDLDGSLFATTGATIRIYLSPDDDEVEPNIEPGDVRIATIDDADIEGVDSVTVFIPDTIDPGDYYVKVTDSSTSGADAVLSDNTVEVVEEPPTMTVDPTSGNVGDFPEIDGEGADDYTGGDVTVFWAAYDGFSDTFLARVDDDGNFLVNSADDDIEEYAIPNSFQGTYSLIVLIEEGGDSIAICGDFTVEPDVTLTLPATYSIEAEALNQLITITGTGFPEGTVGEDTITVVVHDFMDGSTVDTYDAINLETDVQEDADEGVLEVDIELDGLEEGSADLRIPVDGSTLTFEDAFLVSIATDEDDFDSITNYKVSETEGVIGDDVDLSFIDLPAGSTVEVNFIGETVTVPVDFGTEGVDDISDDNGAFEGTFELVDMPGGTYNVRAIVTGPLATERQRTIAEFDILPTFEVQDGTGDELTEGEVGDDIELVGEGFPADATISTLIFGDEEITLADVDTGDTGTFTIDVDENDDALVIPHVSGGGKSVTVTVEGEDSDGDPISAESSVIVNPILIMTDDGDFDPGVLNFEGDWIDFDAATIFPGNPIMVVGYGYLAGETVTVKLYDEDDDLLGTATISSGEKPDSSGDLEAVTWLPVFKDLAGYPDSYLTVEGATSTNTVDSDAFDIAELNDANAKIFFNIEDDGDLDFWVEVGQSVRIVGVGFSTKGTMTLNIAVEDIDVKDVTVTNGYFDTTAEIPELQGYGVDGADDDDDPDGLEYTLTAEDAETSFLVVPAMTLTPSTGFTGNSFTVSGTGFEDGLDVEIVWVGVAEDEVLDTVDGDDVEDGSFSISVDVPTAIAQAYRVRAVVEDDVWDSAAFTIASAFEIAINNSLTEIINKLAALDIAGLNTAITNLQRDVASAAQTAQAAQTAANAAKTSADSATSAANAAKTSADAAQTTANNALTAANAAKASADSAKASADGAKAASDGLTGLVYAAIVAAAIAAAASIGAVFQLMRKVVG